MKIIISYIFLGILVIAGIVGSVYFYMQNNTTISEKEGLIGENMELQSKLSQYGPMTNVYTVKAEVFAGKLIKEEELLEKQVLASSINENYILNPKDVAGQYYKIGLKPGSFLTNDVVMKEEMLSTTYERDLVFDYLPIGLREGDYVDIRMVLPYGEEFVVIERERVEQVMPGSHIIKVRLDEEQLALWTSALTDYALWSSKGLSLHLTKYVEPGLHDKAIPFYPVRTEMESIVTLSPNIRNKKRCINSSLRTEIEKKLQAVLPEDEGDLSGGKQREVSALNGLKEVPESNKNDNSEIKDELGNVGDSIPLNPTDLDGNDATITEEQDDQADGDGMFGEEGNIE